MSENSILQKIQKWCEPTYHSGLRLGIGDDAALLHTHGRPVVFCSDLTIENTHFDRRFSSPEDIGHKSVSRVLSDIAAMGAEPIAVTISIALPKSWTASEIEEFLERYYKGAASLARAMHIAIAGGDLSRLDGPIVIDVAAVGESPNKDDMKSWRRSAAHAGDLIFVTGRLGGAAFALREMQAGRRDGLAKDLAAKHLRPVPRFDIARALSRTPIRSAMDISDGLIPDLARLCSASNVSAVLNPDLIPCASNLDDALYGGDDYELILVIPSEWAAHDDTRELLRSLGAARIGHFETHAPTHSPALYLESSSTLRRQIPTAGGHDPF